MKKLHFAVIAVDGCITSAVFGPIELVEGCRRMQAGVPEIEPCAITTEILSPDGAPFLGSAGYRMPVDGALKNLPTRKRHFPSGIRPSTRERNARASRTTRAAHKVAEAVAPGRLHDRRHLHGEFPAR